MIRRHALLLTAAALAVACGAPEAPGPPATAADAARILFEIAEADEPAPERLDALFGEAGSADARAALLDGLEALRGSRAPRVLAEEPLQGLGFTAVDLECELPGGGAAEYTVHVTGSAEEGFVIAWFAGPGVEWPPPRRRRDSGLTTSAHRPPGPGNGRE